MFPPAGCFLRRAPTFQSFLGTVVATTSPLPPSQPPPPPGVGAIAIKRLTQGHVFYIRRRLPAGQHSAGSCWSNWAGDNSPYLGREEPAEGNGCSLPASGEKSRPGKVLSDGMQMLGASLAPWRRRDWDGGRRGWEVVPGWVCPIWLFFFLMDTLSLGWGKGGWEVVAGWVCPDGIGMEEKGAGKLLLVGFVLFGFIWDGGKEAWK